MYLVDGQRYEADEHGLERALAAAYDDRIRPLCLCCDPAVPVYITRFGETFVLKRMPFTGSRHAVGCSHYEAPAELSGVGEVSGSAISEDPDTGFTQLRVGFSLSKDPPRNVAQGIRPNTGFVRSDGTRLSLRGLLHYLWSEAELTLWHPGFSGKRSWAVVRNHLLTATKKKFVCGAPLAELLYVPEAFTVADQDAIRVRRGRHLARGLGRPGRARPMMIVIGEVKKIVPTRYCYRFAIKHAPDLLFLLDGRLHERLEYHFKRELSLWTTSEDMHLIVAATFALTDSGQAKIDAISLIPTTAQWLPVNDEYELRLIDRLVGESRTFEKMLEIDAKGQSRSAWIAKRSLA